MATSLSRELVVADIAIVAMMGTALIAAAVNGALGYGFSSLTVPVALVFAPARTLVPALVLVEVVINSHQLFQNRAALPRVTRRVAPLIGGVVPGVVIGALALASLAPTWIKLSTYAALLPLAVTQALGVRRPLRNEAAAGVPLGVGVGILYATTSISGPPLALLFNNQGLTRGDFRAALALVRTAEALLTLLAFVALGQLSLASATLSASIAPAVIVGAPLGHYLVRKIDAERFRVLCMSFDTVIVSVGLLRALVAVGVAVSVVYGSAVAAAVLVGVLLLVRSNLRNRLEGKSTAEPGTQIEVRS
jgi:uncharacterized protein